MSTTATSPEDFTITRIKPDSNGNGRLVVHFLALITDEESAKRGDDWIPISENTGSPSTAPARSVAANSTIGNSGAASSSLNTNRISALRSPRSLPKELEKKDCKADHELLDSFQSHEATQTPNRKRPK